MAQRRRSANRFTLSLAVIFAIIGAVVAATTIGNDTGSRANVVPGAAVPLPAPNGVTDLGSVPVPVVARTAAWTGSRMLVFGSSIVPGGARNTGADYDPATGDWRSWPTAPFKAALSDSQSVWTGHEFIVAGSLCDNVTEPENDSLRCDPGTPAAAAYEPNSAVWRELPSPPNPGQALGPTSEGGFGHAVGWNGSQAVFSIATGGLFGYSPGDNTWSALPEHQGSSYCMADGHIFVWWLAEPTNKSLATLAVAQLKPGAGRWDELAVPDSVDFFGYRTTCTDSGIILSDINLDNVWLYSATTGSWSRASSPERNLALPPLPDGIQAAPGSVQIANYHFFNWTGKDYLLWNQEIPVEHEGSPVLTVPAYAIAFDPNTNRWREAIPGPGLGPAPGPYVWIAGSSLLLMTDSAGLATQLLAYNPSSR